MGRRLVLVAIVVLLAVIGGGRVSPTFADSRSVNTLDQSGNVGLHTSMALDASGNPVVAYIDRTTNVLKVLHCGSPACTPGSSPIEEPLPAGNVLGHTSIAINSLGNPVIAYYETPPSGNLLYLVCNDPNCAPGGDNVYVVDSTGDVGRYVAMKLSPTDRPTFAYYDATNTALKVVRCYTVTCGTSVVATLDSAGTVGEYVSMTFDSSNRPVVAYQALNGTNRELRLIHCDDIDCAIAPTPEVVRVVDSGGGSGQYGYYTSITLDSNGYPVIAHIDDFFSELRVVHCNDANCTSATKSTPASSGLLSSNYTAIKLDSNGFPVVAFYQGTDGDLKVLHCDDANCAPGGNSVVTADGASSNVGQYASMQITGGLPVIAYYDATNQDLKVARCENANCSPGGSAGTLQFSAPTYTVSEGAVQATVTVTREGGSTGAIGVTYSTSNGTATAGSDYTTAASTLSWSAGETASKTFTVQVIDDGSPEPTETVNLALSLPTGGASLGAQSTAILSITDNDAASPGSLAFASASFTVGESDGSRLITVSRTGGSAGSVGVTYATSNGTATAGSDYTATGGTLSWSDGDSANKSFSVTIAPDTDEEADETVTLTLSAPTGGASLGSPSSATLTITDDDGVLPYAPSSLRFNSQPSDGIVNQALPGQPVIAITDAAGNVLTSDNTTAVTLTLQVPAGSASASAAAPEADLPTVPADPVPVYPSGLEGSLRIPAPESVTSRVPGTATAQFRFNWIGAWPADAKSALTYAAQIWGSTVTSSVPIDVDATWGFPPAYLGDAALARGGPRFIATPEQPNRWQLTTLYNRDKGSDQAVSSPDIDLMVNSTITNYYYGLDGIVPAGKVDFVSTMLHELGHGLGLVAGARANDKLTQGYWGSNASPFPFASFIRNGIGQPVFDLVAFPANSAALLGQFTGGSLFFAGSQAQAAYGGQPVPLYAPNPWNGSNVSHLAESFNGTADALMTYAVDQREALHDPGPVTRAILRDLGWAVSSGGAGNLHFGSVPATSPESAGVIHVPVVRGSGTAGSAEVTCGLGAGGTAVAGADFTFSPQVFTWAAGNSDTKYCDITVMDDVIVEANESVTIVLSDPKNGVTLVSPTSVTITIVDNDGAAPSAGVIQFATTSSQVLEASPFVDVEVARTGGTSGPVQATCSPSGGTASGGDYTISAATVSWATGESGSRFCRFSPTSDATPESAETVILSLTGVSGGATVGAPAQHTVTINDDDTAPSAGTLQFGASQVASEGQQSGSVVVSVTRVGGSAGAVDVLCRPAASQATFGTDFTMTTQRLSWAAGDTSARDCIVTILPDQLAEGVEVVNITLSDPRGGATIGNPGTATVTIQDDDGGPGLLVCDQNPKLPVNGVVSFSGCKVGAVGDGYRIVATATTADPATSQPFNVGLPGSGGTLQFNQSTQQVNENAGTVGFLVNRVGGSLGSVTVTCSASGGTATGADYRPVSIVLSWASGDASSKLCPVTISDDDSTEPNKTFNLTLSLPTGATLGSPTTMTVTIVDDDPPRGTLQFTALEYVGNEAGGIVIANVSRANGSAGAVSVLCSTSSGGSATPAADFTAATLTLQWAAGDTSTKQCPVVIANDSDPEPDETINVQLLSPGGGATLGTLAATVLRITDNDSVGATLPYPGPAVGIPDGNISGISVPLVISGAPSPITDLDVFLHIHHTWVGDLIITLRSPLGTEVTLVLAPGAVTPSDFGCSGNDIEATFNDAAPVDADTNCSSTTGLTTGPYRPLEPLSTFNGENPNGTWYLDVVDRASSDVGSVQGFSMILAGATPPPATVSGHVYQNTVSPANAVAGALVSACTANGFCRSTSTDAGGAYAIADLPAGSYTIRTHPPQALGPATLGPVALIAGQTLTNQDLVVVQRVGPPPGTTITSLGTHYDGLPNLSWSAQMTLTTHGCVGGNASYAMSSSTQGTFRSGPMFESPAGTYTATIAPTRPISGYAHIAITITCPGGAVETVDFDVYIDPSGYVRTTTGEPIPGATVTLYRSESFLGPFVQVPNGSVIMSMANRTNPGTTDGEGHFGWDVTAGFYRVRAAYPGCVSPTDPSVQYVESAVLVVPPPVTDLDLRLDCGTGGPQPMAVRLTPSSVKAGQGKPVRVVVSGTGITGISEAVVNGSIRSGVSLGATGYEITLSADEVQVIGEVSIAIETPGAGRSAPLSFAVRSQSASDANCDLSVSLADAVTVRRQVAGLGSACAPDADLSGATDAADALYILRVLAGILPE